MTVVKKIKIDFNYILTSQPVEGGEEGASSERRKDRQWDNNSKQREKQSKMQ